MKAGENAAGVEKKAAKDFYPELADAGERALYPLHQRRNAEPDVGRPGRFDNEQAQQGKNQHWQAFQTP